MANPRPLSPHLQVYRWQVQMATSIFHRATGIILALGLLLIVAALLGLISGPGHWACISQFAAAWYGKAFLFLWTWAFTYHLVNGLKFLWLDGGKGFAKPTFIRNGWLAIVVSLVLAVVVFAIALSKGA